MGGLFSLLTSHHTVFHFTTPQVAELFHFRRQSMASADAAMPFLILFFLLPLLHVVDSRNSATQMAVGFNTTFPPSPPVVVPSPVTAKPPPSGSSAPPVTFPTPVIVLPPPEATPPPAPISPPTSKPPPASIPSPVTQPPSASPAPRTTVPSPVSKAPPVSPPVMIPPPVSTPPPASVPPPVKKPTPVTSPSIDCNGACQARCRLSSRPNLCVRACSTCCYRCKCVPSGTAGHYEECPCYASQKTRNNKPKCP